MKNSTFIIILCIIFIIIFIYIIDKICNSSESLDYFIYDSKIKGPTIMIIGGTHGNEPSGHYAIKNLINSLNNKDIELQSGKLILVPSVNYCALKVGIRMIPTIGDLNRKYPTNLNNLITNCPTTNKIINLVKNADFVLDFHEGWGFNRLNKNSMGSSITPSITPKSHDIAKLLLDAVNKTIKDNNKNFIILTKDYKKYNETVNYDYSESIDIKGSLRYFENILNKDYILIETTGQNNIQPLDIRIKQCELFINTLLTYYNLI
jgi:hypothetical protein